jgi:serine-type D-Ala-D-Ala carboxypeptidase (penicillin-binding protein 5/6)
LHINDSIKAPVKKGDLLGYIEYKRNDVSLGKVNVIAAASIEKSIKAKAIDTAKKTVTLPIVRYILIGVIICLLVLVILRIVLRKISKKVNLNRP